MHARYKGVNRVKKTLADGTVKLHFYHRATGTKLEGQPGTASFAASFAAAGKLIVNRQEGTLSGLIRDFEKTAKWRKLAESTQKEYRRVFKFWDGKYGTVPLATLSHKSFRQRVLEWHDEFSEDKPREADNRVTILARILSWAATDADLAKNVLETFDRAYDGDRSDMIWLPDHVEAFMGAAEPEMQLAMVLALHTGQRQADIRKLAWTQYDGKTIALRQGKTGREVRVPCTVALKKTLDAAPRRGALILLTKTERAFQKRYFAEKWDDVYVAAKLPGVGDEGAGLAADPKLRLHFHDIRGTTVTMLFEAGCTVAEVASITGHSLRRAQEILDKYLSRTSGMATNAIAKFEAGMAKGATE
ncbi:tyrosine-type recombinase/integrase [Devosia neptuniae]|uniref:Tyrosine-type recombinase/integrase n=1 Tax=Devosia neptuniae TaxID=191302 RepID=A0ABY6CFD6_9HYPH|nr:tyrosine-type recombinase/integrase [Devosia neptuniae]UXN70950.1 tyrosine-type recombinase/integrase [Devosia neptuniae]